MTEPGVLLVPQKDLDFAKSRLALAPTRKRDLAVEMLRRTVQVAAESRFAAVVVVLDNPDDAKEIADLDAVPFHPAVTGLNEALVAAEDAVRTLWGDVPLCVMPADLALATPVLLNDALRRAAPHERAFIPDASGFGTTLLFAGPEVALSPAYGVGSAAAHHQQGAWRLLHDDLTPLRHDVDDLSDLVVAHLRIEERQRWEQTA